MAKELIHLPLSDTYYCNELKDKKILVTGHQFIKTFSLETYQEIQSFPSEDSNYEFLVTPDQSSIFIVTNTGLKQYSFPDFVLLKVHQPLSSGLCLKILNTKNVILFPNNSKLLNLDLNSFDITEFAGHHESFIYDIVSTSDENTIFTVAFDKSLKKWNTNSSKVEKSIELEFVGRSLFVIENSNSESEVLLVGMINGSLLEFSLKELILIKTVRIHDSWITKIIRLSSGDMMSCSDDGDVGFPLSDKKPIKVSDLWINSFSELSDQTLACCCANGLTIIRIPS